MGAWLRFAFLLGLGWASFGFGLSGARLCRRRQTIELGLALVFGALLSQIAYLFVGAWHRLAGPLVLAVGGHGLVFCCGLLMLLGVVWAAPKRRISRDTLVLATTATLGLHLLAATPAICWRYVPAPLGNCPDAEGVVSQTTPITCMAACAAMAMAREGVLVSEGDMAHWAGTSPVGGTDSAGACAALSHFGAPHGLRGVMGKLDLVGARRLGRPFIATINDARLGLHTVWVTRIDRGGVTYVDPAGGCVRTMPHREFATRWFDVSVWLEPAAAGRERPTQPPVAPASPMQAN